MKTTLRQNVRNADRVWYVVDAAGETLGTLATDIALALRGKARVDFTPHVDGGDYVVVLNADQVSVSGNKELSKKYYNHSRYLGHLKTQSLEEVRAKKPARILQDAVAGMLPKTKHRKEQLLRLKLVMNNENPHAAQNPQPLPRFS